MLVSAVMKSVCQSSPQPTLAGCSGILIVPRCLPDGENTHTPPGPVVNMLALTSILKPSGSPPSGCDVVSANTRPLLTLPSAATSYALQIRLASSELAT